MYAGAKKTKAISKRYIHTIHTHLYIHIYIININTYTNKNRYIHTYRRQFSV